MPKYVHALAAMGLVTAAAVAIGGRSVGQDGAVQKASADAAGTRKGLPAAIVGVIDMDAVFKGYHRVEFVRQQIESEATLKKADLNKIQGEAQQVAKAMAELQPGTADFKNHDAKLTKLQADFNAAREQAQRDFAMREAEALAMIYKEIQAMVESVAKHNRMNFVLRVSNEPVTGADPQSALAAMSRSVVWSDGSSDITTMVVKLLNQNYEAAGGQRANPASTAAPAAPTSPTPGADQAIPRAATGNPKADTRQR